MNESAFEFCKKLGGGTSGNVYNCKNLLDGKFVAIKIINNKGSVNYESKALNYLKHPRV